MLSSAPRRWPWLLSATLHLVILAGLGWGVIHWPHRAKQQAESLPVDPQQLSTQLKRQRNNADHLTDSAKLTKLDKAARKIELLSSQVSVEKMGRLLRRSFGARDRAFAPANPAPPGPFDHDSGLIYTARKQDDAQGNTDVIYVMVDKEGRSLEVTMPAGTSTAAANAIERMNQSPTLSALYEQIVLPMLDVEMQKSDPAPPTAVTRNGKNSD